MGVATKVKRKRPSTNGKQKIGFSQMEVSKLVKADWNYKRDDAERAAKLVENIKKNGQLENIIVRQLGSKYEVVNGNHRLDVFLTLGVKVVWVYNLGKISQTKAERIAVETNETRFDTDPLLLGDTMKRLLDDYPLEDLATTLPYDPEELLAMSQIGDGYAGREHDEDGAKKDFDNPLLAPEVDPVKLFKALGIKKFTKAQVDIISEAITRERKKQKLNLNTVKGNTEVFVKVCQDYILASTRNTSKRKK